MNFTWDWISVALPELSGINGLLQWWWRQAFKMRKTPISTPTPTPTPEQFSKCPVRSSCRLRRRIALVCNQTKVFWCGETHQDSNTTRHLMSFTATTYRFGQDLIKEKVKWLIRFPDNYKSDWEHLEFSIWSLGFLWIIEVVYPTSAVAYRHVSTISISKPFFRL